jgi:hypothetical protein
LVAIDTVVGLEMDDHGLDSGAAFHLAPDGCTHWRIGAVT